MYVQGIAEMIVVSPDGTRYAVGLHRRVDIYSIENAGVEYTIDMKVRRVVYDLKPSYKFRRSTEQCAPRAKCLEN